MKKPVPPKLKRFPAAKQRLLDRLLDSSSEGSITESQRLTLERLVGEAEQLMADNARLLARFSQAEAARAPSAAVPVTVWVMPETAER